MFLGSLLIAIVLICFGAYLQWNETYGWHEDNEEDSANLSDHQQGEIDRNYFHKRGQSRKRIHWLIIGCGLLVAVAAFAGKGVTWVAAWMIVMIILAVIVLLAGLDAVRTIRYQRDKREAIKAEFHDG